MLQLAPPPPPTPMQASLTTYKLSGLKSAMSDSPIASGRLCACAPVASDYNAAEVQTSHTDKHDGGNDRSIATRRGRIVPSRPSCGLLATQTDCEQAAHQRGFSRCRESKFLSFKQTLFDTTHLKSAPWTMPKTLVPFLSGIALCSALAAVNVLFFFLPPIHIVIDAIVLLLSPLLLFLIPIILTLKHWKTNRAFSAGIIVGIILEVIFFMVAAVVASQARHVLFHKT